MDMLALAITDPLIPGAPKLKLPEIIRPRPRTTARRPPCQWRSNGRFSRFKEPGPPTVRGPRLTVSLVRQAVNTLQVIVARHKCGAIGK